MVRTVLELLITKTRDILYDVRHRRQRCRDIHLVQLDALCYEPAGEETVFFFNFPFRQAFMTRVVGNIERSLTMHPRRAFLVFVNPETAHVVDRSPAFEPLITDKYFRIWRTASVANPKDAA